MEPLPPGRPRTVDDATLVAALHERIAELQRELARYRDAGEAPHDGRPDVSLAEREQMMLEVERLAHVGSWWWDLASNEVWWSEELFRILGYDPEAVAPSVDAYFAAIHPEDVEAMRAESQYSIQSGRSRPIHIRIQRPDGTLRYVTVDGSMVYDEAGVLRRVVGAVRDNTELHLAAQAVAEADAKLLRAQKEDAIGRLAAGIAHDFNNLLAVVDGNLSLLADDDPSTQYELRECRQAVRSGTRLTRRLLAMGRRAPMQVEVVPLDDIVHSACDLLRRTVGGQIELTVRTAAPRAHVRVDAGSIEQVLINLVLNARDAAPEGGSVQVVTEERDEHVVVTVRDDGQGMCPDTAKHAFEPFFTTKGKLEGTGLGLATVLGTVEQHGGSVTLESRLGEGTTVRFTLPRVAEVAKAPTNPSPRSEQPTAPLRVLLLEDDPRLGQTIERMLARLGHQTVLLDRGAKALHQWPTLRDRIDLVLCDVVMPDMRGPALISALEQQDLAVPVLFITGYSREAAGGTLAHPVLAKPFRLAQLSVAIADLAPGGRVSPPPA